MNTPKSLGKRKFAIVVLGTTPFVLWAFTSLFLAAASNANRAILLSFRFYSTFGGTPAFNFYQLPVLASICILTGAALLIWFRFRA